MNVTLIVSLVRGSLSYSDPVSGFLYNMVPSASQGPMLNTPQGHVVSPHDLGLGAEGRFNTIMHQFSFQTAL